MKEELYKIGVKATEKNLLQMIGVGGKTDSDMRQQKVGEISNLRKEALEDPWVAADWCVWKISIC